MATAGSIISNIQLQVGDPSGDFLTHVQQLNVSLNGGGVPGQTGNIVTWTINGTPLDIDWELPTLKYVQESNDSFPVDLNLIKLPEANAVSRNHPSTETRKLISNAVLLLDHSIDRFPQRPSSNPSREFPEASHAHLTDT